MSVTLSLFAGAGAQFFDNSGNPLTGGKLYTYAAGTTTPLPTYTTLNGNISHTNPIVLDAAGRISNGGEIWLTLGVGYKFVVKTSDEVLIATYDNIPSAAQAPAANDADSIMYEQGYTVTAGSFVTGSIYRILTIGSTDFTLIGASSNTVGLHFIATGPGAGTGTAKLSQSVQAKLQQYVSVKDFGAVGNGVANDTAALIAAEAAAYATGAMLYVPAGTYNFNGAWTVRVSLFGYGAKIQETATTYSANVTAVIIAGADNIVIQGISVDGNLYRTGFSSDGKNKLTFRDCVAKRCINGGYMNYYGNDILLDRCYAEDIRYQPANAPADGFLFQSCTCSTWRDCEANNFRRIGFVCEGDGTTQSEQITALRCIAHNANNCDDSATEFNAAFWGENTNSIDWVDCVGYDLAGNTGQTSGRVRGMVGFALGNNKVGTANLVRCRIYGGAGYMPVGITVEGSSSYATLNVTDCYVEKARTAFSTLAGFKALNITRFNMNNIVNVGPSNGGLVFDAASGGPGQLKQLVIDNVTHQNCTFDAGSGVINFFSAATDCDYTLLNSTNLTHVTRNLLNSVFVQNCDVACGSNLPGIGSFLGNIVTFVNCNITSRNNSNSDLIVSTSAMPSQGTLRMQDCVVQGFGTGWIHGAGGTNIYIYCDSTKFANFCWSMDISGDFQTFFRNCDVYQIPATYGFVYSNYSSPVSQILIVQNCYFQADSVANTPLRKWNFNPTASILQGNVYRAITSLYDFTGGVTQANNVSV